MSLSLEPSLSRRILPAAMTTVLAASAGFVLAEEPRLRVQPERVDLGEVPAGATGTLEFTVTNGEDRVVRLVYIFAECDCSFDLPADGTVPPEGSFHLEAHYHLDEAPPGWWEESITLLTDHPRNPEITIPISARVVPENDAVSSNRSGG
jgi:hypothetical protein